MSHRVDVMLHVGRCTLWGALLWLSLPWPPLAAAAAAGLYFMSFAFFHDAAHGALGLPPWVNDLILMITSAPLMMSGHGQRQLHLRHHARPLAADDLEGAGALQSLLWAVVTAPMASVHMRVAAFSAVNPPVRKWVAGENAINIIAAIVAIGSGHLGVQCAFLVALLLQLTMNAWASHVPHRAPQWLLHLAGKLAWTRSPVVLSLVYHLEHHAQPRVPCAQLRADLQPLSPLTEHVLPWAQLQRAQSTTLPSSPLR